MQYSGFGKSMLRKHTAALVNQDCFSEMCELLADCGGVLSDIGCGCKLLPVWVVLQHML